MSTRVPLGLVGGALGAFGALPLVSAARGLASRLASAPELPGAAKVAGDVKAASFAEAGVVLALLPLAALFFGALLPRWFEKRVPLPGPSFEWAAAGFALAFPLWRAGLPARAAILAGLLGAFLAAVLLARRHRRGCASGSPWDPRVALRGEPTAPLLAAAGSWEVARRAATGELTPAVATVFLAAVLCAIGIAFRRTKGASGVRSRARPG